MVVLKSVIIFMISLPGINHKVNVLRKTLKICCKNVRGSTADGVQSLQAAFGI